MTKVYSILSTPRLLSAAALAAVVPLISCGTPEYRAEYAICERTWLDRIPPVYRERLVNKVRYEEVPAGPTSCTTVGATTTCTQGTRQIEIPYVEAETIDIRKQERDVQISACARAACVQKFGNAECEIPGS